MSYELIYTVPFANMDNIPCVVEIEKEDYIGISTELIAGETPFVIDIDNEEFLYTPTRFSTAKLTIVGNDYLRSLFSTAYRQYRVMLKVDNVITWCGFIKPELYTQDYTSETFILEIECMSAMSVLEFIDYSIEGDEKNFVSIWRILQKCIVTSYGKYDAVYLPYVYGKTKNDYSKGTNVLDLITISEQNFFDEDNKPMKLSEVLEEICKFLNWTCVDWKGGVYFIDIDHSGAYNKYDFTITNKIDIIENNELTIQGIGFAGTDHSLDVLPGFNKIVVKCDNYVIGTIFSEENFDVLSILDTYDITTSAKPEGADFSKVRNLILQPNIYKTHHYGYSEYDIPEWGITAGWYEISEDRYKEISAKNKYNYIGAKLLKRCVIPIKEEVPIIYNYDYDDVIFINPLSITYIGNNRSTYVLPIGYTLLELGRNIPCAFYTEGAISINATITVSDAVSYDMNFKPIIMYFEVKIGNIYYNGKNWVGEKVNFGIEFENKNRSFETRKSIKIKNTKTLDMPYNGAEGYIIPIRDIGLAGIPKISIVGFYARGDGNYDYSHYQVGCFIESISVHDKNKQTSDY